MKENVASPVSQNIASPRRIERCITPQPTLHHRYATFRTAQLGGASSFSTTKHSTTWQKQGENTIQGSVRTPNRIKTLVFKNFHDRNHATLCSRHRFLGPNNIKFTNLAIFHICVVPSVPSTQMEKSEVSKFSNPRWLKKIGEVAMGKIGF
jgi:hypothetical protein